MSHGCERWALLRRPPNGIGFDDLQKADAKRPATRIPPGEAISERTRKLVVKKDIQKCELEARSRHN
jgi:hypothetical protein